MKPELFNHEKSVERTYIHTDRIEEQLSKNPSWLLYYSSQASMWEGVEMFKKQQRDARAGEITVELKESGEKGVTDKYIEAKVKTDPEYQEHVRQYNKASEQVSLYKGTHFALDKKQFVLQAMNARAKADEMFSRASSYQDTRSYVDRSSK